MRGGGRTKTIRAMRACHGEGDASINRTVTVIGPEFKWLTEAVAKVRYKGLKL